MQVLHPSIVHCIGFTTESPWITIFPFFNGDSIGDMLLWIPMRHSQSTKAMWRLDSNWRTPPPADARLLATQISRLREAVDNMPRIMHALVDDVAAVRMAVGLPLALVFLVVGAPLLLLYLTERRKNTCPYCDGTGINQKRR